MSINKTVESIRNVTIKLTGNEIVQALVDAGHIDKAPLDPRVEFKVPGGGDWSHMNVGIDEDNSIYIYYTEMG